MSPEIAVSVCVPTRHRPGMPRRRSHSALDQTIAPRELELPPTIALSFAQITFGQTGVP
jgi:hypothetical protein